MFINTSRFCSVLIYTYIDIKTHPPLNLWPLVMATLFNIKNNRTILYESIGDGRALPNYCNHCAKIPVWSKTSLSLVNWYYFYMYFYVVMVTFFVLSPGNACF